MRPNPGKRKGDMPPGGDMYSPVGIVQVRSSGRREREGRGRAVPKHQQPVRGAGGNGRAVESVLYVQDRTEVANTGEELRQGRGRGNGAPGVPGLVSSYLARYVRACRVVRWSGGHGPRK